jgi:hypothetical protein
MSRLAWFVAVLLVVAAPIAAAEPAGASPAVHLSLALAPEEHVCTIPAGMQAWHDPSDPLFFATGPTARLDQQELWAGSLAPLVAARYDEGILRLVVLGIPQTRIGFSLSGWRPRWPLC